MLKNYFDTYKDELELIDSQNRVELDLYSIIAFVLRFSKSSNVVSIRDVSGRRGSEFSKIFIGNSGFPDFVVRSREKSNTAKILGAVEIKYISENLDDQKHFNQLSGHINSYKKVIYTNGLEWRFYSDSLAQEESPIVLGEYTNGNIIWNTEKEWHNLLKKLDAISWL